jgi:hypothetical protein
MPAQKRLGRHEQPTSAPTREQSGQRREEGTIGCCQRGARLLAPEHHEPMPQHQQLHVLGELAAPASNEQPQNS